MKILLLVDDYLPHSTKIGAKMMHELAMAMYEMNHEVAVVTPDSKIKEKFLVDNIGGVKVLRFKSPNVKAESKIKRAINESLLSINAYKNLRSIFKNQSFDLIVTYSPSIFFGPLVAKLKKKWGARSYLILRDLFPQWVIDNGLIKESSAIAKYFKKFESINYRAADKIGLQSPKNLEYFQTRFGASYRTEVLYNWSSETPVEKVANTFRKKYGLENKTVFFYGGNMGEAQDMMNLVRLARNMQKEKNAHFVFAGSGNEFDLVQRSINEFQLKNLLLLEPVNQIEYRKMLAEFDIGLFSLHRRHTTHNFPGKLLGYMAQGLPILGSVNPGNDVKDTINNSQAGMISINGEDQLFSENAIKLIQDEKLRRKFGENSFKLLESKFSVQAAMESILKF